MRELRIIVFFALSFSVNNATAQQPPDKCSQIRYAEPARSAPYRAKTIEGQAVYASPTQKWEAGPAGGVCVGLFNASNHEIVANVVTDDKGQFKFLDVIPGRYTFVASAGDLQVLSIAIELTSARVTVNSGRLLLHLRQQHDKRKTFVTGVSNPALRQELLSMVERDQNIRNEMISGGLDHPSKDVTARMDTIDRANTARMKIIINQHGWPSAALVGWDGTEAAFILVQHADRANHQKLLPLMIKEYKAGNLSGPNYALFIDRALVEDGKPQLYGTKAKPFDQWRAGEPTLYPIKDEANVDKRRAEVGLSPLAEYLEGLKRMYYPRGRE